jgi:DNA-binding NtrC family response regulator
MSGADRPYILVVDDEASVRALLEQYFAAHHAVYDVRTASSGEEAVKAVIDRRPALVLLDIEMPGMGGVDALRAIRALDARIPVLMVTGNEDARVAGEVIALGAFSYVPKPLRFPYLDHLVAMVLGA